MAASLLPFTPSLLLHLLQRQRPPLDTDSEIDSNVPWSISLPSSLLFIDVSGFTSLTESFAQSGSSGLEQLTSHLNAYFTTILDRIHSHKGDLLKVAGDA